MLYIEPFFFFFFFLFVLVLLGKFIIHDDKKVIEFFVVVTNQMTRAVDKRALISIRFYLSACKNLTKKKLDALSDTTSNFFHFMQAF